MTAPPQRRDPGGFIDPADLADDNALLLDLDGTLLDIAPTPMSVVVPDGLAEALRRLRTWLGDAFAVVTGRPIEQVDALLGDLPYAVAGEHGGAVRHGPSAAIERPPLPAPPEAWVTAVEQLAILHPGVRLERKERGFVLHYRAAPQAGPEIGGRLSELVGTVEAFELMPASMAWEVRPRGADKGTAVAALMSRPPFIGRRPVFIGDDITDEDGIRAARALGGAGYRVPECFGDAAGVRSWLRQMAEQAA